MLSYYKQLILVISVTLLMATHIMAKPVTMETVSQASVNCRTYEALESKSRIVKDVYPAPIVGSDVAWIVEFSDKGFVIAGGDDLLLPVYYFSEEGKFNPDHPGIQVILNLMANRLKAINELDQSRINEISLERETAWFEATSDASPKVASEILLPLMTSTWGQRGPWNDECPWWSGQQTVTGCVATAMSQIMYYWRHPATGQGFQSAYTTSMHGINIPTTIFDGVAYDWGNMIDDDATSSQAQIDAMAELCYHVGVSVEMDYGVGGTIDWGSGASSSVVDNAFEDHFRYWTAAENSSFDELEILDELEYLRPVYVGGYNSDNEGHAWVIDGYDYSEDKTYLYMNMGWDGGSNGKYTVDKIPLGFKDDLHVVRFIAPNNVYFCANFGNCNGGTPDCMYGSFETATNLIPENSTLIIRAGSNHPGSFTVDKAMTITGTDVIIGQE